MYFAFMLSEKQHFFIGTWSEKQRNWWGGNYIGSSVVTSISLWGPYITNKTFLVTQGCRVQEILSSQIEDTLQSTGSVSLQKRCCLTGNLRGWKRKACSLTWPQKTHTTLCLTSPHKRDIYPETIGSALKGQWWSHYCWFTLYVLFILHWFLVLARPRRKGQQFSFYPQTQIRHFLPFCCK